MKDKRETTETAYEKPSIVDHGDLTELTAGMTNGGHLDASFPAGTAKGQLTFS